MSAAINKYAPWILVAIYMSIAVFGIIYMLAGNRDRIDHNDALIHELQERKEYHIIVSEDNNRLLKSIESKLEGCCRNGEGNGEEESAYQAEEGD